MSKVISSLPITVSWIILPANLNSSISNLKGYHDCFSESKPPVKCYLVYLLMSGGFFYINMWTVPYLV